MSIVCFAREQWKSPRWCVVLVWALLACILFSTIRLSSLAEPTVGLSKEPVWAVSSVVQVGFLNQSCDCSGVIGRAMKERKKTGEVTRSAELLLSSLAFLWCGGQLCCFCFTFVSVEVSTLTSCRCLLPRCRAFFSPLVVRLALRSSLQLKMVELSRRIDRTNRFKGDFPAQRKRRCHTREHSHRRHQDKNMLYGRQASLQG